MKTQNESLPALLVKKPEELLPARKEKPSFGSLEGLAPKQLVQFAIKRNRDINEESVYLTSLYWEMGECLRLLRADAHYGKHGHWERNLTKWGINRSRATKALEIREGFNKPEDCCLLPVNKAAAKARATKRIKVSREKIKPASPPTGEVFQPDEDIQCHVCNYLELEKRAGLVPGTVNLIATDPPYGKDWVEKLPEFAAWCHRMLADGGALVTWFGHLYLPELITEVGKYLKFRWVLAYFNTTPGVLFHSTGFLGGW